MSYETAEYEYHDFIETLPDDEPQPYAVVRQGEFVSIRQWDGTGEYIHWVLVPVGEVEGFINELRTAAQV